MKNFILAFAAIVSLTVVSCREADEVISYEDASTLKIIENNRNLRTSNSEVNVQNESTTTSTANFDGEIVVPPRR